MYIVQKHQQESRLHLITFKLFIRHKRSGNKSYNFVICSSNLTKRLKKKQKTIEIPAIECQTIALKCCQLFHCLAQKSNVPYSQSMECKEDTKR